MKLERRIKIEEDNTRSFIDFINAIDDINQSIPTIIDFIVEEESLKTEYSEEEYSKLVLIDQAMKHDLEKIGIKNNEFKKEIENKIIKDFYLIVGEVLDELLKEIADFSLLYYTVIVDIDLCKKGMKKNQLEEDLRLLIRKNLIFIKKVKEFKNKLNIYKNYMD